MRNFLYLLNNVLKKIGTSKFHFPKEEINRKYSSNEEEEKQINLLVNQLNKAHQQIVDVSWMNKHLRSIYDFSNTLASTLEENIIYEKVFEVVSKVMSTDTFFLALYHEEEKEIQFPIVIDNGKRLPGFVHAYDVQDNITSQVIENGKVLHLKTREDLQSPYQIFGGIKTVTCIFVPLYIDNKIKGVISVQSYKEFAYRKEHEELLRMIGTQAIRAIETSRLYKKVYTLSCTDELTGLKNRRAFNEDYNTVKASGEAFGILLVDLDNLKNINDTFGHENGDLYIDIFAQAIKATLEVGHKGYRYAGDEFIILVRNPNENIFQSIVAQLNEYLVSNPLKVNHETTYISASFGGAIYPEHTKKKEEILRLADEALYKSKSFGKNRLCIYNTKEDNQ